MAIKKAIEQDWRDGKYDSSLFRYKPQTIGPNAIDISAPELVARFAKHKLKIGEICPNSAATGYRAAERILERRLNRPVSEIDRQCAESLVEHLLSSMKAQTGRAAVQTYRAAWEWAKGQYAVAEENPWEKLPERFRGQGAKPVEPFSREEVQRIIAGFDAEHPQDADFVRFMFGTGCRIGEAIALRWYSVGTDFVWISESQTGEFYRPTTKNGKSRRVLLSPSLVAMLAERREAMQPDPDTLVFPDQSGDALHHQDHRYRWGKVLAKAGVTYRKPYATRHTAISHALENGAQPVDVASQTGHSLVLLLRVYAHVINPKRVFVEF